MIQKCCSDSEWIFQVYSSKNNKIVLWNRRKKDHGARRALILKILVRTHQEQLSENENESHSDAVGVVFSAAKDSLCIKISKNA